MYCYFYGYHCSSIDYFFLLFFVMYRVKTVWACCEVNWIVNVIDHGQRSLIKFIFILINLFESVIVVVCLLVYRIILAVKLMGENFFVVVGKKVEGFWKLNHRRCDRVVTRQLMSMYIDAFCFYYQDILYNLQLIAIFLMLP